MTFLLTVIGVCASGFALLRLLRLAVGHSAVDLPLSWFVGSGWYALASFALRFLAGVPYTAGTAVAIVALPVAGLLAERLAHRGRPAAPQGEAPAARWRPRPAWVFAPLALYAVAVATMVVLHGSGTPTQTDDGLRVRAFASILAYRDAWSPEARAVLTMAGPLPSYVPSLGWRVTGRVNHFDVNGVILAGLVSLLALAVGLASARGRPERGWAGAFAVLSLPLFVYHCTSTYSDATLAICLGAAFLFLLEFGFTREPADAERSLLLLLGAAMVKREGELVAGAVGVVLLAQVAWEWRRFGRSRLLSLALLCAPYVLVLAARVASVGLADAFPFLRLAAARGAGAPAGPGLSPAPRDNPLPAFVWSLFSSGNAGLLFWVLSASVVLQFRSLARRRLAWPLAAVALLFAQGAITSLWLVPEFTVNQTTVHRQLLPLSVAAALWVAALLTEAALEPLALAGRAQAPVAGGKRRPKR